MTPHELTLTGFTGILNGLGVDTLTVNLDEWGDGLIALAGINGNGKSTLLDNLHPYRLMPSRAGGYNPKAFSFYDNTRGEALKDLTWSHGGVRYRSVLNIKDAGKTRKTTAYLMTESGGDWAPVTLGEVTSDGKTETYDRLVNQILGSPDLFFTSVFASQERKRLASYGNADIKELLAELLGLDDIKATKVRCDTVGRRLSDTLAERRGRIDSIEQLTEDAGVAESRMEVAIEALGEMAPILEKRKAALTAAMEMEAKARVQAEQSADIDDRRRKLQEKMQDAKQTMEKSIADAKQRLADALDADQSRLDRSRQDSEEIAVTIAQLGERQAAMQDILARKDTILAAVEQVEVLTQELAEKREALGDVDALRETIAREKEHEAGIKAELAGINSKFSLLKRNVEDTRKRSELIVEVPCAGTDLQERCKLLQSAVDARDALPGIEANIQESNTIINTLGSQAMEVHARVVELSAQFQAKLDQLHEIDELAAALEEEAILAGKAPELETAEERYQEYAEQLAQALERGSRTDETIKTLEAGMLTLRQKHSDELAKIKETGTQQRAAIALELQELPDSPAALLIEADAARREAESALRRIEEKLKEEEGRRQRAAADFDRNTTLLGIAERAVAALEPLETEIGIWRTLSKALSNNGIIALSIDDAGPEISAITNSLLKECYGPRFTVAIETQQATRSDTVKEGFDIVVFDGESGEDKSISAMSGGEKLYINEVLTRGIALFQAQSSDARYETLFSDESDGALDADKKLQFMQMKRKVLELGGYQREIFVSHTPELWSLADNVINMGDLV